MPSANNIRSIIEDDGIAFGARTRTNSPVLVDVYGQMGFDFVFVDTEHTGISSLDSPSLQEFARAADATNTEILVRLSSGRPEVVRKVLDAGIRNVIVPRVETARETREAVEAAYYTYDGDAGQRGVGGSYANQWGIGNESPEAQDENVFVTALIETQNAVANIDEILSVPQLGAIFLGPADLSVSYGHPQEPDHPEVQSALDQVWKAARNADVPVGCFTSTTDDALTAIENGARLVQLGDELAATRDVLGDRLSRLESER